MRTIELHKSVTASNDRDADLLRGQMRTTGQLLINLMSSPGSGKTSLLSRTIQDMTDVSIAVLEADIASDVDALRIEALGARSIQAHTDGMCHMDAGMTRRSLEALAAESGGKLREGAGREDLIFLENVGNLICPAEFDTGAGLDVMILSVPEGDDKPLKYPLMFSRAHALVITKTDTLSYFDFDLRACMDWVRKLNPKIRAFPVSAKTGEGMEAWENWLRDQLRTWRSH